MPFLEIQPGSGGGGGGVPQIVVVPFDFSTASPLVVQAITTGQLVKSATIRIDTVFDDATATLALGTTSSPSLFLATNENVPTQLGDYESIPNYSVTANENIELTITPGASTQGAGVVIIDLRTT